MPQEIERKFLIRGEFRHAAVSKKHIVQGYLSSVPERSVRIRIKGGQAFITVKGASDPSGVSRFEWEKEIPVTEAQELLRICEPGVIDKTRYYIPVEGYTYEVDEFHGDNEGLVLAEIELHNGQDSFFKPEWLGTEVTGDERYYNAMLSKHPYKTWSKD